MEDGDGRITVTLDGTAAEHPKSAREDSWSEEATSILIDAWGERHLALDRGNLKQTHWNEVADIVNSSREMHGRTPKTDMQCKNRIDTVKRKFKLEKSKMVSRRYLFDKLDRLIGSTAKTPAPTPLAALPPPMRRRDSHSPETERSDSPEYTDTYPPKPAKKPGINNPSSTATSNPKGSNSHQVKKLRMSSVGELTKAILNLGEAFEQAETAKLNQVMEMEKQRMTFTKDMELQRMQLLMKTQLEISQMKEAAISSYHNNHHHHQLLRNDDDKHIDNNIRNHSSDDTQR